MFRAVSIAAAIATSTLLLGATASHAQPAAPSSYYVATPIAKPVKTSFLTRETVWKWRDGAFVANKAPDRDLILCSLVAQRAGKLSAFTAGGTALAADVLDKCNSRAN